MVFPRKWIEVYRFYISRPDSKPSTASLMPVAGHSAKGGPQLPEGPGTQAPTAPYFFNFYHNSINKALLSSLPFRLFSVCFKQITHIHRQ